MSDARHALLTAIFTTLMADNDLDAVLSGGKVFDHVPRGASHPFVSFGDFSSEVLDPDETPTERHRFDLLIHSRASGRTEASDIATRIEALLHNQALTLAGCRLIALRLRNTAVAASRDRRSYRVRMRFEALTEKQ
ncbi:MAG: DUF3168 domain-containing protein [Pseudomonadota bacterium]